MKFYKWTADNRPIYGNGVYDLTGAPQPRIDGELVMCKWGYHVCAADQVPRWCGTELWEVEPVEIEEVGYDKTLCRSWRVVRKMPWTSEDMVAYARACANRELELTAAAVAAYIANAAANAAYARAASIRAASIRTAIHTRARAADRAELKWQRQWIENRIGEAL